MTEEAILSLENVSVEYDSGPEPVTVVRNVSLDVYPEEILGLIGESGSGKSTLAYTAMRLLKNASMTTGTVRIAGRDIYAMKHEELRQFRWAQVSMAFQTAMNALNPVMTVGEQILDTLNSHQTMTRGEAAQRAQELLHLVRLSSDTFERYPHELSGGMRQRVVIAISIALNPQLVIMDEPTTGLDVVVQRTILDEIVEIQRRHHFAILFISHDFQLVSTLAHRVAIMYAGKIVEVSRASSLHDADELHHPYTQGLIRAVPRLTDDEATAIGIPGNPPDPRDFPKGCAYADRCPLVQTMCRNTLPELEQVGSSLIACHVVQQQEAKTHGR
ncbi:MAG: dipeptide/oligopeptide/nickel ABC transporter ATP-binding protein [Sulfobacillus benefaciens]|uniref:Dipeptide/oligopeptide/nickel ABC transporter ATP-binding protein n=1 Tax=Sulfobacillus benefaciens TaxID=453960 RepID=A0A2T2XH09_9FIRM|nr:MAG: dipeptide/oligopeptide/nickel ABC transporter ATP-binding protein [Sulfobacillus benefaciens]